MGDGDRTFGVNFSTEGVSRLRGAVEEKLKEFMGDYTDDTLVVRDWGFMTILFIFFPSEETDMRVMRDCELSMVGCFFEYVEK